MRSFVPGMFYLAPRTQGPSTAWHTSVIHSLLWLNIIPLYGHATCGLSVDGHLGCSHPLTIADGVAMNIHAQGFV